MVKIRWTSQALSDIDSIAEYISKDSHYYAQMFVVKIFESVESIQTFPGAGRIVPEINNPDIREIVLGNYRIIYRHSSKLVEILTVYHSARLLKPDKLK